MGPDGEVVREGVPLRLPRVVLGSSQATRSTGLSFSNKEDVGVTVIPGERDRVQGPEIMEGVPGRGQRAQKMV